MNERMSDDQLVERLRRTLDTEAARIDAPEDAWERFQAAAAPGPSPQRHRDRRLWLGVPSGVVGLAAAILIAVIVTRGTGGHGTQVATSQPNAAAASAPTTRAPTPSAAATGPAAAAVPSTVPAPSAGPAAGASEAPLVPGGFSPLSVTFVSPSEGWVLGHGGIEHTTDGGRTWALLGVPATDLEHLRFADAADGWAWNSSVVWATHDGGRSWARLAFAGLTTPFTVEDLEASAGTAHLAVTQDDGTVRILTTPVTADAWQPVPLGITLGAGPVPSGQLVLQGSVGWFIQVDRTVVAGARLVDGQWQPWTPPCLNANGPAVLAASSPTELVAACDQGVWGPATPTGEQLWVSHDGGSTWTDAAAVPDRGVEVEVATSGAGVAVVAGTEQLEASFDGGRTWSIVFRTAGTHPNDLGFTSPTQGVVVLEGQGAPGSLVITRDGGRTWNAVAFP